MSGTAEKIARRCWSAEGIWGDSSCPELARHTHCFNCPVYSEAGNSVLKKISENSEPVFADMPQAGAEAPDENKISLLVFECAGRRFAVKSSHVSALADVKMIHRIPHRGASPVEGISNIGGELIVTADIARIIGLDSAKRYDSGRIVVCGEGEEKFAFCADNIFGIFAVDESEMCAPADQLGGFAESSFIFDGGDAVLLDFELIAHALKRRHV